MAAPHNSLQTFQQARSRPSFKTTTDDHLRVKEHCLSTSDDQRPSKVHRRGKFVMSMSIGKRWKGEGQLVCEEILVTSLLTYVATKRKIFHDDNAKPHRA